MMKKEIKIRLLLFILLVPSFYLLWRVWLISKPPHIILVLMIVSLVLATGLHVRGIFKLRSKKQERSTTMPLCGFNPKMLKGLTEFSQGLCEQVIERSSREGIPIERAFEVEIQEMNIFLSELDRKYYEELRPKCPPDEAMRKLIEWTEKR
jgi:hypothetical protein